MASPPPEILTCAYPAQGAPMPASSFHWWRDSYTLEKYQFRFTARVRCSWRGRERLRLGRPAAPCGPVAASGWPRPRVHHEALSCGLHVDVDVDLEHLLEGGNSAVSGCSRKIWTGAVSSPSGGPQRPESSLAGTRSPEGPFKRSSRIRFTWVRSGTRTSAIPGQHQAIVDRAVWERTQQQLQEHRVRAGHHDAGHEKSPLIGRLVDENRDGLTPGHARKGERKCRYYVSRNFPAQGLAPSRVGWRLPARELEDRVAAAVGEMLGDDSAVLEATQKTDINSGQVDRVRSCGGLALESRNQSARRTTTTPSALPARALRSSTLSPSSTSSRATHSSPRGSASILVWW
jgi:hypothetical protein